MILTGADILMECLLEQGVDTLFGYPGGQVLAIYDALYKYQDRITHYLTAHEQGAAHAADGYARSTGRVGVCIATSGPGATNLVTGIATAYMDSSPMVAITGNVPVPLLGKDSFQEVDITGITMPITKHNYIVKDIAELADTVRQAFYIARHGRPGPVLVDIPSDIAVKTCAYEPQVPLPVTRVTEGLRPDAIEKAVQVLQAAERPLILVGGGVIAAEASPEIIELARRLDAPVCTSAMGLGGIPASDPHFTGMIGMHGTVISNRLATECDLLVAAGSRFSNRVISNVNRFAPEAKVLHIDVDPAEINKNVLTYHALVGDVKEALHRINALLPETPRKRDLWSARVAQLRAQYMRPPVRSEAGQPGQSTQAAPSEQPGQPTQPTPSGQPEQSTQAAPSGSVPETNAVLKPQYVIERIAALTAGEAVVVTEVGQHQMWACHHIPVEKPRTFITSGGLGTMGFGLGAAIGAAVGNPGTTVVDIAGDGCFRMNSIELATAVEYNAPLIVVILNNHTLGMVRQWQTLFYGKRYSHTTLDSKATDFVKLAEAYGAAAFNVTRPGEFDAAFTQAMALKKTAVINCEIGMDDKVFPMVAPGAGIDELIVDET